VSGPQGLSNLVRTGGSDFTSITQYGTIGYMDSTFAARYGLPTVRIKYSNGKSVVATPKTIDAAIASMHEDSHHVLHPNYGLHTSTQYPMPVVSYMVIPHGAGKSDSPPPQAVGDAVGALVKLAAGLSSNDLIGGYAPLPPALVKEANTMAGQIWKAPPEPDTGGGNHNPGGDDNNNSGTPPVGQGTGNPTTTGPGITTPSSLPPTGDSTPTPSSAPPIPQQVLPALAPPSALIMTSWSKAVPIIAIAVVACLILGAVLLFGGDVRGSIKRGGARMRAVSPLHRKDKPTLHSVDSGSDEAAA